MPKEVEKYVLSMGTKCYCCDDIKLWHDVIRIWSTKPWSNTIRMFTMLTDGADT